MAMATETAGDALRVKFLGAEMHTPYQNAVAGLADLALWGSGRYATGRLSGNLEASLERNSAQFAKNAGIAEGTDYQLGKTPLQTYQNQLRAAAGSSGKGRGLQKTAMATRDTQALAGCDPNTAP